MRRLLVAGVAALAFGCAKESNRLEAVGAVRASPVIDSAKPAGADLGAVKDACGSICERSAVLKCKNADQCLVNCLAAASGTPCNPEFLGFYRCLVPQPIANWECAEDGVAAVIPGVCDAEQQRAIQCMKAKVPEP